MSTSPEPIFEHVSVSMIERDPEVNTSPLNQRKVAEWAERGFDPQAFGTLLLSQRKNGTYIVLDGQHRMELVASTGGFGTGLVPAMVYKDLTRQEEARIYRVYNYERTKKTPEAEHLAKVTEEDPTALHIEHMLEQFGIKLSQSNSVGSVRATKALYRLYERDTHPDKLNLQMVLSALTVAFGESPGAISAAFLDGLGKIYQLNDDRIRHQRVIDKLREFKTPRDLRQEAAFIKRADPSIRNDGDGIARVLINKYNLRMAAHNQIRDH